MKIRAGDSPVFLDVGPSVIGGENLKADAIRSLLALRTSFYESPNGQQFSRVQLLTIGDLLAGKARRRICFNPTQRTHRWATMSGGRAAERVWKTKFARSGGKNQGANTSIST